MKEGKEKMPDIMQHAELMVMVVDAARETVEAFEKADATEDEVVNAMAKLSAVVKLLNKCQDEMLCSGGGLGMINYWLKKNKP